MHTGRWRHGDKPIRAFTDKALRVSKGYWRRLETWRQVLPDCCVGWDNFGVDDVSGRPAGASGKVTLCFHQGHFLRKETRTAITLVRCRRKWFLCQEIEELLTQFMKSPDGVARCEDAFV